MEKEPEILELVNRKGEAPQHTTVKAPESPPPVKMPPQLLQALINDLRQTPQVRRYMELIELANEYNESITNPTQQG